MGRKIPAKKHRGVKDPLEQQARRIKSEQGRVNAPPADPDEQPVPRSLLRLFAPAPPRQGKGAAPAPGGARAGNPVSRLARAPGESPRQFSRRITDAARALHGAPARYPVRLRFPLSIILVIMYTVILS